MTRYTPRIRARGFSLVELMVAMAIGMVITLAITVLLTRSENARQSFTALNDTNQSAAYASFVIDRVVRSAGSGFNSQIPFHGCQLLASRNGVQLLPRVADLPAPFTKAMSDTPVMLAPVIIHKAGSTGGSDVLAVMTGSSGKIEAGFFVSLTAVNQLMLGTTLGLLANDMVLLAADRGTPCMLQQVAAGFNNAGNPDVPLALGGVYYAPVIAGRSITDYGGGLSLYALGNTGNNAVSSRPQFMLYGVDDKGVMYSYDILQTDGTGAAMPIADGVMAIRAVYGVDSAGADKVVDEWIDPVPGSPYEATALMAGSALLDNIVAVRVGMVLRSPLRERNEVMRETELTLFGDLNLPQIVSGLDPHYRYRTVEVTVPVRNMMNPP